MDNKLRTNHIDGGRRGSRFSYNRPLNVKNRKFIKMSYPSAPMSLSLYQMTVPPKPHTHAS